MIETYGNLVLGIAPLVLAALIIVVRPLPLKQFQGIYLLLGAAWVAIHALLIPEVWIVWIVAILVAGELFHIIMVGWMGNNLGAANHASILVAVGLFPWYIGIVQSIIYVFFCLIIGAIFSQVRFKHYARKYGINSSRPDVVKKELSNEDWVEFQKKASLILAGPFAIAAVLLIWVYPFI